MPTGKLTPPFLIIVTLLAIVLIVVFYDQHAPAEADTFVGNSTCTSTPPSAGLTSTNFIANFSNWGVCSIFCQGNNLFCDGWGRCYSHEIKNYPNCGDLCLDLYGLYPYDPLGNYCLPDSGVGGNYQVSCPNAQVISTTNLGGGLCQETVSCPNGTRIEGQASGIGGSCSGSNCFCSSNITGPYCEVTDATPITFDQIVSCLPPSGSVDIRANSSNGPISISFGSYATISWTSSNVSSCSVSPTGWTGTSNPGISTGNLTSSTTYSISCDSGTATDSVDVRILSVGLSALPNSGSGPLNGVDLTATVSGVSTGTFRYFFDCQNDGFNELDTGDVSPNPYTAVDLCSYSTSSTAKVTVWHNQGTAVGTTPITVTNSPPVASSVTATEPNYCSSGPAATINWTYSDPNDHPQSAYQVQIDDTGSAWNTPLFDSGKVISSGTSYFQSGLTFNITYKARTRVWDSLDLVGSWTEMSVCNGPGCLGGGNSWKTPKHAYPAVDFTWSPLLTPSANKPVQFTDLTQLFDSGGTGQRAWSWLFNAPNPSPSSTLQNPIHTYTSSGAYNVSETVTDRDGYTCSRTKPINIQRPIPIWKEVSPK